MDPGRSGVLKGMPTGPTSAVPSPPVAEVADGPADGEAPDGPAMAGFEAFYAAQVGEAMRLAELLTSRAEAHDLVHDAFVGLLQRWDDIGDPLAYLRRSLANRATNVYRHRAASKERITALRAQRGSDAEATPDYLADMIAELPAKQRAVVVLRYYLQLREREIAELLDMRPGSVGPTLTRALRQLKKEI
ncbi:MAG: putative polymerase subfamily sigma factor [Acidimicrobiales bacterium]|nr:putative polymerase subfamily sigma factor [Acidimicrobiales bacterium]